MAPLKIGLTTYWNMFTEIKLILQNMFHDEAISIPIVTIHKKIEKVSSDKMVFLAESFIFSNKQEKPSV